MKNKSGKSFQFFVVGSILVLQMDFPLTICSSFHDESDTTFVEIKSVTLHKYLKMTFILFKYYHFSTILCGHFVIERDLL